MKTVRTGTILNTERYEECVTFYRTVFALPVLFQKSDGDFGLTCFELQGSYLMVESGGTAKPSGKSIEESAAKLRFHVEDLEEARRHLQSFGIEAEIQTFAWGSTINLHDPDGNRIGIRDEAGYLADLQAEA